MSVRSLAAGNGPSKKTRRSKKRRTAEVSDSDSSSSSSSSDSESEQPTRNSGETASGGAIKDIAVEELDVELSDLEEDRKNDVIGENEDEVLDKATRQILNDIPLTTTELSEKSRKNVNNIDLTKIQQTIQEAQERVSFSKDEGQLKNAYLSVLFKHYGEDVNSLREAQDFTPKSLVLLANVLKDGGNMFDIDTLRTVVESEQ
ncbi:LAME_0D08856g1_1 [Lachancea meyersii CBS 8951]|uniref:Ribosome assembly protein 3 n=1 Tax=Lachancea meyersii CBS 8951 TaxID=1266667 RepID=A0A1G4JAR0_9SACH|nr:LAME_0D08856g1_1 [Lachancea meyersii CBS 8951]